MESIKNRFRRGIDFNFKNWLSPTKSLISVKSQKSYYKIINKCKISKKLTFLHGAPVSKTVLEWIIYPTETI